MTVKLVFVVKYILPESKLTSVARLKAEWVHIKEKSLAVNQGRFRVHAILCKGIQTLQSWCVTQLCNKLSLSSGKKQGH